MHTSLEKHKEIRRITFLSVAVNSLGLDVLAEGIETADQEAHLRTLACNAGQGCLYAKPLPPEGVRAFALAR